MNEESKISQIKLLSECFAESPKTMYQAERETGVRIANICRFIDKDLQSSGRADCQTWNSKITMLAYCISGGFSIIGKSARTIG